MIKGEITREESRRWVKYIRKATIGVSGRTV